MYLKFNRGVYIFFDVDLSNIFLLSLEVYIFYEVESSCRYFLLFLIYFIGCLKGLEMVVRYVNFVYCFLMKIV